MKYKAFYLACLFLFLFNTPVCAQSKGSLEKLLWKQIGISTSLIEEIKNGEEEGHESKIIDDTANGYLRVEQTEDGCGCYYESTAAAYKEADGGYTFLNTYWNTCSSQKKLNSNKELKTILPENFWFSGFYLKNG